MDWQKIVLIGSIVTISFMLLFRWNEFSERNRPDIVIESETTLSPTTLPTQSATPTHSVNTTSTDDQAANESSDVPTSSVIQKNDVVNIVDTVEEEATSQLVHVVTDTLDVLIDTHGGDIVKVALLKHDAEINGDQPYILLNRNDNFTYIAQSGLVGPDDSGTDSADGTRPVYTTNSSEYVLAENEGEIAVDLAFEKNGISYIKRFLFTRGDNLIKLTYLIDNKSQSNIQVQLFGQIKRDSQEPIISTESGFGLQPFLGAATTTPDSNYEKVEFKDLAKERETFSMQGGWVAMVQHYFLSVWVPNQDQQNTFTLRKKNNEDLYLLSFTGPPVFVSAGSQSSISADFYAGPKHIDRLEQIAEHLDLTIDFGILWWIAKPLFNFLKWINSFIGNWGWSIIILTIIIKAVFFKLSATSYRSMAKMRKVAPKMQSIKERCGDDRQKMSQEMMKLYKTEKVNPMGGCLPILVQMPVFIALYWVILESVEMRHAPFILWIEDLSVKDPYFILPIFMGVSMYIQQKLNPTPPDPTQAKVMQWLPVIFTFMFLWFPSGLVLYWSVNNTLSILQQYVITKQIEAAN